MGKKKKKKKKQSQAAPTPTRRQCGTMEAHFRMLEQHPEFRQAEANIEALTQRSLLLADDTIVRPQKVVIPVVVHVVYKKETQNISPKQIKSQIRVLRKDFRAKNADINSVPSAWQGLVKNSRVGFRLATTDPSGNPTKGITRTKTGRDSFGANDSVKFAASGGADAWPSDRYLNMWVCQLSGGLLGYAQFPGGPAETDGVVVTQTGFGTKGTATAPFDLGRTTTHEVGHWLNLRHIWGDANNCVASDFADDTPTQRTPNTGKPAFPHVSCDNGPNGDMFMNYMDYVDDDSMFMFSAGQVARMRACLAGPRRSFL